MYISVKIGRLPGIYNENENWYSQIEGFKYAEYKEFDDIELARKYMKITANKKLTDPKYTNNILAAIKTKKNFY